MREVTVKNNPNLLNPDEITFEERQKQLAEEERKEQEKTHKSPFTRFYQVNKDTSVYLRKIADESPKALKLLFFIFDHMDKYNAVVCSYKVLQEALAISESTIKRAVKYLKNNGFISVYKTGTSNVYIANPNLVWNSWGNNIKYCEFPANIILSATEQEKAFDKRIQTVQLKGGKIDESAD